ncbi:hypothetical protein D9758_019061 [Tetrapyrgos nigripes]|uniref:Uncharacterized protein n=1 Tax=Tetrapyrgos nigripes TaxID=182062 RepID=A0A8H5BCK3_9AGAR|nr:hypothetical protein D9758_019061 [Tetrapyrgos nigripes]
MSTLKTQQQSLPLRDSDLIAIKGWMLEVSVSWLLCGMNAALILTVIYAVLSQQKHYSKPQLTLFVLVALMFIFTIGDGVAQTLFILIQLPEIGYGVPNIAKIGRQMTDLEIVEVMPCERLNYLIGDGIVVWRAWVLFPGNRFAKGVLTMAMIISCAGAGVDAGINIIQALQPDLPLDNDRRQGLIYVLPLLGTNIIATGFIGYKAWSHHQDIRKNLSHCGNTVSQVQKILVLLVESGILYCVLWVGAATTAPFSIFANALPGLTSLYPILIILAVTVQKAEAKNKSANEMSLSQSIRFTSARFAASQAEESQAESQVREPSWCEANQKEFGGEEIQEVPI